MRCIIELARSANHDKLKLIFFDYLIGGATVCLWLHLAPTAAKVQLSSYMHVIRSKHFVSKPPCTQIISPSCLQMLVYFKACIASHTTFANSHSSFHTWRQKRLSHVKIACNILNILPNVHERTIQTVFNLKPPTAEARKEERGKL